MVTSYNHGHQVEYDTINSQWVYSDTKEPNTIIRSCKHCGLSPTKKGYDACIGFLPNVINACCGHNVGKVYAMFKSGEIKYFENIDEMKEYFKTK